MPAADTPLSPLGGLTVAEVAKRLRVGEDKVRSWVRRGDLGAINTASHLCSKPRFVILPQHLAEFERGRQVGPPPKPPRRRKRTDVVDYYP